MPSDEEMSETIAALVARAARGGSLTTVEGEEVRGGDLGAAVERFAGVLRSLGLGPGDRVGIVLPNGPEMALSLLAAMVVGSAAPLNPKYREEEFRFYLEDLRPAAVIVGADAGPGEVVAAAVPAGVPLVRVAGQGFAAELTTGDGRAGGGQRSGSAPSGGDEALVLHTSGTTSRPKIVPLRQRNLYSSAHNIAASLRLTEADRSLAVMPLFHIHGIMAGLLAPLSAGGGAVVTPGFDAFGFHRWLAESAATYYTAVPTMHQMVLARAPKDRPHALRLIRSSSARLPAAVREGLEERFAVPVIEAYGMTEASHQIACSPLPPGPHKPGSVGVATGVDVAILDREGRQLPAGERGEISIKGPTVITAYENNPGANEAAFTDGWFRTGDEGVLDEDGYLFITGRLKEQINKGGEKISPLEVDEVLLRHPKVAEAVTFAIPHDKLGEEVGAAVVRAPGEELSDAELRRFLSERLAAFKVPRTIVFVDEVPKGATGKLQRIGLWERLQADGR